MQMTTATPGCWVERYESLRRHFLEQPGLFAAAPFGLAILKDNGLACWMRRWIDGTTTPEARTAVDSHAPTDVSIPPGTQLQLTLLLAQMTAAHLPTLAAR